MRRSWVWLLVAIGGTAVVGGLLGVLLLDAPFWKSAVFALLLVGVSEGLTLVTGRLGPSRSR